MLPPESRLLQAERFYALIVRTLSRLADHRKPIGSRQIELRVFRGHSRTLAQARVLGVTAQEIVDFALSIHN